MVASEAYLSPNQGSRECIHRGMAMLQLHPLQPFPAPLGLLLSVCRQLLQVLHFPPHNFFGNKHHPASLFI